jgi:hypothetical protein
MITWTLFLALAKAGSSPNPTVNAYLPTSRCSWADAGPAPSISSNPASPIAAAIGAILFLMRWFLSASSARRGAAEQAPSADLDRRRAVR